MCKFLRLLMVGLLLSGCQTLSTTHTKNDINPFTKSKYNSRGKDVLVTFAAWSSEKDKQRLLEAEAALVAVAKCGAGNKFRITDRISKRWNEHELMSPSFNFIEGNVQCLARAETRKPSTSDTSALAKVVSSDAETTRLRQELAALKAQQKKKQQSVSNDQQQPNIVFFSSETQGPQAIITGRADDNVGIAEIRLDGKPIEFDANGDFSVSTYVPEGGKNTIIEAIDLAGLIISKSVFLERSITDAAAVSFEQLNPLERKAQKNSDAIALIIGVETYSKTAAKAIYAENDAAFFKDYAIEKLGVPASRVQTLLNASADEPGMLLAVKDWLLRTAKTNKSDIYIFFAGHGLASDDGRQMYLLPHDGEPRLLSDTAVSRERLFADIAAANPRSVTVFLDTCYSGTTRGTETLIASRPIAIRAKEQIVPEGFTVMTAAAGDQTAKPLEEAKHGMFSYFLMKGMEGDADANQDNQITAGELHAYVQQNVIQQSSGSQTPELQGDRDRVLVRFQ